MITRKAPHGKPVCAVKRFVFAHPLSSLPPSSLSLQTLCTQTASVSVRRTQYAARSTRPQFKIAAQTERVRNIPWPCEFCLEYFSLSRKKKKKIPYKKGGLKKTFRVKIERIYVPILDMCHGNV